MATFSCVLLSFGRSHCVDCSLYLFLRDVHAPFCHNSRLQLLGFGQFLPHALHCSEERSAILPGCRRYWSILVCNSQVRSRTVLNWRSVRISIRWKRSPSGSSVVSPTVCCSMLGRTEEGVLAPGSDEF